MNLMTVADLSVAPSFKARLSAGIITVAGQILPAAQDEMPSAQYNKRYNLAGDVLRDPLGIADRFVWPVLANPAIQESGIAATDNDIIYQITAIWDAVAGVTAEDKAVQPTS